MSFGLSVNCPEAALPERAAKSRLLHIHRTVPGVLAPLNERLADAGISFAAQYLATNEDVGHVVIDVDLAGGTVALADLCAVHSTIRCRLLY